VSAGQKAQNLSQKLRSVVFVTKWPLRVA